jgi:hypothetical protein
MLEGAVNQFIAGNYIGAPKNINHVCTLRQGRNIVEYIHVQTHQWI